MLNPLRSAALCLTFLAAVCPCSVGVGDEWPQFRGAHASGIAHRQSLPDSWSVDTGENIAWSTPVPGLGHASPIVSGGRVFVVTAVSGQEDPMLRLGLYGNILSVPDEGEHEWIVLCLSQSTGEVLWQRVLYRGVPKVKRHTKATHANSTPTTDGKHLVVCLGSEGLYCLDFQGELLWNQDLGVLDSGYYMAPAAQWEFATSPIIDDGVVYMQCDVQEDAFLAAFRVADGVELWRTERTDVPTWSTPTIVEHEGGKQLVVNGYRHAGGYDPATGKSLWKLSGGGDIPVPTPIYSQGMIFLTSAHGGKRPLRAVLPEASGDITPAEGEELPPTIAWDQQRQGVYMQTPLVYDDQLYACRTNGLLTCYEAASGERLYRKRLGSGKSGFTASPVAADGKLYFVSEDGDVHVLQHGPEFNRLATNAMGEPCMATPAIADGLLLVRTTNRLVAIGTAPTEPPIVQNPVPPAGGASETPAAVAAVAACLPDRSNCVCKVTCTERARSRPRPACRLLRRKVCR